MKPQIPLDDSALAENPRQDEIRGDGLHGVAPDLAYQRLTLVNVVYYGAPDAGDRGWVLIDTGLPGSAGPIAHAAERRYGAGARPAAIVMTHGHFDHIGGLKELAERWDAPIYAHTLELRYLDGSSAYLPPDPSVGGLMAATSPLFPRGPIDVRPHLQALPADGSVPGMPGWSWIHTPGHTEGHVSFWRETDRCIIAGDAFITTRQESAYAALTQELEMHGPPAYFTPDWASAKLSVQKLAQLDPELAVTGHGRAVRGPLLREALHALAREFDEVAVPEHGRYVDGR